MKKVKSIFKRIPKEKLIILLCAIMSAVTLLVSVVVFVSAGEDDGANEELTIDLSPHRSTASFSPDSPKSLEFQSLENNTCIILSVGSYSGVELEIPEKSPYGEIVIGIAAGAFEGCEELESVHIPASVTSVGEGAFKGCS